MTGAFKSDESFLTKLALGAAGTKATMAHLASMGFQPIELERGSTGYKIWRRIKIKRIRVPDILCLRTGLRFESRGKTSLEVSMSHSVRDPARAWDADMADSDWVALAQFERGATLVEYGLASPIHYVSVRDLREAFHAGRVRISDQKGAEEGSERRVVWPSAVSNCGARVESIDADRLKLAPTDGGRRRTVQLRLKDGIGLDPQVAVNDHVQRGRIVASVVSVTTDLTPPSAVSASHFVDKLADPVLSERYAAAKALRHLGLAGSQSRLRAAMGNRNECIYVRLEAAAALAKHGFADGWDFMVSQLGDPLLSPLEAQLETVIVASELGTEESEHLLVSVLAGEGRDEDLRAGAAWGLGQRSSASAASALAAAFTAQPIAVRAEAARALLRIAEDFVQQLVARMQDADRNERAGLAWVLARTGGFRPQDLLGGADEELRRWLSYIVGNGVTLLVAEDIAELRETDPEVYFAASVLWQMLESWTANMAEY